MALDHILFNDGLPHGRILRNALTQLENGLDSLDDCIKAIQHMIDGDGTSATHFTYVQQRFSFADTTAAKAAWDELNSLYAKLTTNVSVADVNAALLQAFAKFR